MSTYSTDNYANGQAQCSTGMSSTHIRVKYVFAVATTLAANDVINLVKIPPGYAVVGIKIDTDALGTGVVADAGIMNAGGTAVSAKTHSGVSLATAGFVQENAIGAVRTAADTYVGQNIGIVITTGGSTATAVGGIIGATITVRPKQSIE